MKLKNNELCHCGKPLHYSDKEIESYMNKIVQEKGRYIDITSYYGNKTYKVDRHYIALHGIMGNFLDKLGFEEIK
jgi:hypothetical protein